ncbi:uncharacterized protein F5147DRAFT_563009 [Suillus discolor]|uniref:Uncharacterized protein n=1 Tax=Suillus discolor TaxID=1912936 RepID=A0A9P7FJ68_9AGAM|nr:uncharacterized protein F5147DRAFT_563009 [Suillus discolor]KAG2120419.1 hypothetical protein F5147DRAFT_563009 [Suillus discolor]
MVSLRCSDQDIQSDGSHVEGTHKGWNSLQRAQPSGIVMLSALGHDFVLRQNIRVASSRHQMTPFVKFTHSSHHIQLSNHIARLYNGLHEKDTQLLPLPELPDVDSGETFGLVVSDNTTTFGGLLVKEETADAELTLTHNFEVCTDSFTGGTINFATEASRSIMIEDWQIDLVLLDQPATQPLLPHATKVVPASPSKHKVSCDCPSTGINNAITQSQHLFSIATGIDPHSLTFQNSDEFYLFMDMRAEFKWLSCQMTLKHWVLPMEEYNCCFTQKAGRSVIQKNPQALLHVLGDIKPKLMNHIIRDGYTSKRNNETFWCHHCSVVPLVKEERGKNPRKAQTCSCCQTIMYPGPKNSPLNHKRGYCADGIKQVSKNSSKDLPPLSEISHPHCNSQ